MFVVVVVVNKVSEIGLVFNNRYAWAMRWNTDRIIVEVRAYLDSDLIAKAITENESEEYTYTDQVCPFHRHGC